MRPSPLGKIVPGTACFLIFVLIGHVHQGQTQPHRVSLVISGLMFLLGQGVRPMQAFEFFYRMVTTYNVISAEYYQKVSDYYKRCLCTAALTISASSKTVLLVLQCHDYGIYLWVLLLILFCPMSQKSMFCYAHSGKIFYKSQWSWMQC